MLDLTKIRSSELNLAPSLRPHLPKRNRFPSELSGEEELVEEGHVGSHMRGIWESSSHGFWDPNT